MYPSHQATGSVVTGSTVSWPAHQSGDVGFLVLNTAANTPTVPSDWTLVGSYSLGTAGGSSSVAVYVYWKRATSASEPDASILNHRSAVIFTVRGAKTGGNPVDAVSGYTELYTSGNASSTVIINGNPVMSRQRLAVHCGAWAQASNVGHETFTPGIQSLSGVTTSTVAVSDNTNKILIVDGQVDVGGLYAAPTTTFGGGVTLFDGGVNALVDLGTSRMLFTVWPAEIESQALSSGSSTASFEGTGIRSTVMAADSSSVAAFVGISTARAAMSSSGSATAEFIGNTIRSAVMSASGTSTAEFVSGAFSGSSFSSSGSSSANFVGASNAAASFNSDGSSLATFYAPIVTSSSFSSSGSSTAQFFSPTLTVTTLTDGSGGVPNGEAIVDWSICDYAEVELDPGTGTYSIEHVNLIRGKHLDVFVTNNGASGQLIWDDGDAPVDWGPSGAPDMPAEGETLHVQFVARSLTEIRGREFWG